MTYGRRTPPPPATLDRVIPPVCPACPTRPPLWKDTSTTMPGAADHWHWHCAACRTLYEPTASHKVRFTYAPLRR
ncbi:hypothetical protein ACFVYD_22320 [Streptomyces sp. NPDC058301]|uniref:hypothetical protein n=1 Tax=Streptomyces sp. NPDC058301 TaxID=3346436 RepID=UPI0036E1D69D